MSTKTDMLEKIGDISNCVTLTTGGTSLLLVWFTPEYVLSLVAAICTVAGMLITWYCEDTLAANPGHRRGACLTWGWRPVREKGAKP